jgi:protein-disulfide isomerase
MAQGANYEPKAVPLSGAIVAVIIAALAGFIVGKVFAGPAQKVRRGSGGAIPVQKVEHDKAVKLATEGNPPAKGPAEAKVTVVLVSDFMCPFCSRIAPAFTDLSKKFGDRVRIVFRPFPLAMHQGADLSAEAALAANAQGKFWAYHDILFDHQDRQARGDLENYAQQLGLDMNAFRAALDSRRYKPDVDQGVSLAKSLGISGTPTLVINDSMVVGPNPGELAGMVQRALDGKPIVDASKAVAAPEQQGAAPSRQAGPPPPPPPMPDEVKDVKVDSWNPIRGSASAPIKMVVFCEYLCPFCKRIQATLAKIREAYGDKVQFVFRNLIIHGPPAELPAKASLAAWRQGADKWNAFHDLLFAHQGELREGGQAKIEELAGQAGLDVARLRTDMQSPEVQQELEADKAAGALAGAGGTPSSFINGRFMSGARPPSHFGAWIDKLLGITTPTLPASADPQQRAPSGGCGT